MSSTVLTGICQSPWLSMLVSVGALRGGASPEDPSRELVLPLSLVGTVWCLLSASAQRVQQQWGGWYENTMLQLVPPLEGFHSGLLSCSMSVRSWNFQSSVSSRKKNETSVMSRPVAAAQICVIGLAAVYSLDVFLEYRFQLQSLSFWGFVICQMIF